MPGIYMLFTILWTVCETLVGDDGLEPPTPSV